MLEKKQIGNKTGMKFTPSNDGKKRIYRNSTNRLLRGEVTPGQATPQEIEEANRIIKENPMSIPKKEQPDQSALDEKLLQILNKLDTLDTKEVYIHHDADTSKAPQQEAQADTFKEVDPNKLQADIYNQNNVDKEVIKGYDNIGKVQKKKNKNKSLVDQLRKNIKK